MKKKLVVGIFLGLIALTVIMAIAAAVWEYNYEVQYDDILTGVGAIILLFVGGIAVFYEIDLFYTVYYLFFRQKTVVKTVMNVSADLLLLSSIVMFFGVSFMASVNLRDCERIALILFLAYVVLRIVYAVICMLQEEKE